jgi:uncharacterized protein
VALINEVSAAIVAAMKAKEQETLDAMRMLKTALTMKEVEKGRALEAAEELQVVNMLVKQRRDSIEQFTRGGRKELADKEQREIAILERYLPPTLSLDDVARIVDEVVTETGSVSAKDFGRVMKGVMAKLAGRNADGKAVSEAVKARLS